MAFFSSFTFFYLMTAAEPGGLDFFAGRVAVSALSLLGLVLVSWMKPSHRLNVTVFNLVGAAYILLYLYLLHINSWSLMYRWAYFVVGLVFSGCAYSWHSFVSLSLLSFFAPVVFGFWSPLNVYQLAHFHASNIVIYITMGISLRNAFEFRKEVVSLTEKMAAASQLLFLGKMAGGIAHEVNNPLAIINGTVERIKRDSDPTDLKLSEGITKIQAMVKRISKVTQGLLYFSKDSGGETFDVIDIRGVVQELYSLTGERLKNSKVEFRIVVPEEPCQLNVQVDQVRLALIEILDNAIDAVRNVDQPRIELAVSTKEGRVSVSVTDNGPGIPPKIINQIMHPFFTTKEVNQGMGLGLSVAQGIVKRNKGEIQIHSVPSLTTVVISFDSPK
ncbi:MAG: ATP-binding protein [Bdellovibrionales bacterium]|nr:ATP-binding protein [Bdellovibrionales bacterium]